VTLHADDRVLLLAIPTPAELAALARTLSRGVLVALGPRDEVDNARAALTEFDNVMFIDAAPDRIPWRDQYFTKILVPPHMEAVLRSAAAEVHRVLAAEGEIVYQRVDV
jgi:hypothetical protein